MKAIEAITGLLILLVAFAVLVPIYCYAQDEILPMNPPHTETKAIHIMTAEERSEIIIQDIWQPPELARVKIGAGARLGNVSNATIEPYGWQAFVGQDAKIDDPGVAYAYGRM